jgi:hypothetical protein
MPEPISSSRGTARSSPSISSLTSFLEPRHCGGDIDRAATQLGHQTVVQR